MKTTCRGGQGAILWPSVEWSTPGMITNIGFPMSDLSDNGVFWFPVRVTSGPSCRRRGNSSLLDFYSLVYCYQSQISICSWCGITLDLYLSALE